MADLVFPLAGLSTVVGRNRTSIVQVHALIAAQRQGDAAAAEGIERSMDASEKELDAKLERIFNDCIEML